MAEKILPRTSSILLWPTDDPLPITCHLPSVLPESLYSRILSPFEISSIITIYDSFCGNWNFTLNSFPEPETSANLNLKFFLICAPNSFIRRTTDAFVVSVNQFIEVPYLIILILMPEPSALERRIFTQRKIRLSGTPE